MILIKMALEPFMNSLDAIMIIVDAVAQIIGFLVGILTLFLIPVFIKLMNKIKFIGTIISFVA